MSAGEDTSDPNVVFGRYEVVDRLGEGGMGEVLLARQRGVADFARVVALKTLRAELAEDEAFVHQFLDEARVAAALNHPNIVSILEVGRWAGTYVMAMEYIRGEHVGELIRACKKVGEAIPPVVAAQVTRDAASALHHAHEARDDADQPLKIVHRDISTNNIMVRVDGVAKVVDFGIARAANRWTRTATGQIKGKLRYMSPEQLNDEPLDGRCDQYSLGVVLWEMLTGERLFSDELHLQNLLARRTAPVRPPSEVAPGVPPALDEIALTMLRGEPAERFDDCGVVAQRLGKYLEGAANGDAKAAVANLVTTKLGENVAARTRDLTPSTERFFLGAPRSRERSEGSTKPLGPPEPPPAARRRWLWVSAVAGAALAAIAGLWLAAPSLPSAEPAVLETAQPSPAPREPAPETPPPAPPPTEKRREPRRAAKVATPAAAGRGYLTLSTTPWTRLLIGGESHGSTPIYMLPLPAGRHVLVLKNEEVGLEERREVEILPGEATKLNLDLR